MAPEILALFVYGADYSYDEKIDIYSLGVILYILATGHMPYKGKGRQDIINKTLKEEPNFNKKEWEKYSPEM